MIQQSALILTAGLIFLFFFTTGYGNAPVISQPITILLLCAFITVPAILIYLLGRMTFWRVTRKFDNPILLSRFFSLYSLLSGMLALGGFIAQVYYLQTPVLISKILTFFSFENTKTFLCIIPLVIAMTLNRLAMLKLHCLIQDDQVTFGNYVLPDLKMMFLPSIPFLASLFISDLIDHSPLNVRIFFITHYYLYWLIVLSIAMIMFIKSPFFISHIWKTKRLQQGEILNRIESFAKREGLRYKAALVWNMGGRNIANAGMAGLLPGSRSVFLTDSLLHNLDADEIEAIIAHEFGHIKYMHIPAYVLFSFGYLVFFSFIYTLFLPITENISLGDSTSALLGALTTIIIFCVYFIFIFRYFSRKFERQADLYAISTTGNPEAFKRALFKVASINRMPLQSSRFGKIFRTHPSIYERLLFVDRAVAGNQKVLRYNQPLFDIRKATVVLIIAMLALWVTGKNSLFPPSDLHYEIGRQYAVEGMFDNAIAEFHRVISIDPKSDGAFYALGLIYTKKGKVKEAEIEFKKALEINPKNTMALEQLKQIQKNAQKTTKPSRPN